MRHLEISLILILAVGPVAIATDVADPTSFDGRWSDNFTTMEQDYEIRMLREQQQAGAFDDIVNAHKIDPSEVWKEVPMPKINKATGEYEGDYCATIRIDLKGRKIYMQTSGSKLVAAPISSGRKGMETGIHGQRNHCYEPLNLDEHHVSSEYHAPMPYSIFFLPKTGTTFNGEMAGIAIHEGNPNKDSHGCIHVPKPQVGQIFKAVSKCGKKRSIICLESGPIQFGPTRK